MRYHPVAILLHWTIALGILALIAIGLAMTHLGLAPMQKFELYQLHKSIGVTVLLAVLLRILWRLTHRPPPLPAMPPLERAAAEGTHALLYVLMLVIPLSGWALVSVSPFNLPTVLYGLVPWPHLPVLPDLPNKGQVEAVAKFIHGKLAWMLAALIALHAAAALRHQFVLRNGVLDRILPFGRRHSKESRRMKAAPLLIALTLLAAAPAKAADTSTNWTVDPARSHLGFSGIQNGAPFKGSFGKWTARIAFDPAHPEAATAKVTIDLASATTGDAQRDGALPQAEWFNVKAFPQASFEATGFTPKGGDAYEAPGKLTIRGIGRDVVLPFTLTIAGDKAVAKGHLPLVRTGFGVGQGVWATGEWVALDVGVDVDLVATEQSGS